MKMDNVIGRAVLTLCVALVTVAPGTMQLVVAASQAPADPPVLPSDAEIRTLLADRIDVQRRNLGIVVGIVTPAGRRLVTYGRAGAADTRPLTGDTIFEIGSVTKVFTAALLADMVRRGEVTVDDPVGRYLSPDATVGSRNGRTITLADLATHTSGLPFWPSDVPTTRDGALSMARYTEAQLFAYLSSFAIPEDIGSKWVYSNVDAGVLGLALGRRAKSTYESLLATRLTGPLGLASTAVTLPTAMRGRLVTGHDAALEVAPPWLVPALPGAGALHSSANDLLTFLAALDGDRSFAGVLDIMLRTRRPGPGIPQALGWWVISTGPADDGILTHDGGTLGFASSIAYDRKTRTGVVVLSNTVSSVGDIARHLLRPVIPLTRPAAPPPRPQASGGKILPGLRMPCGSNACLSRFISAITSGDSSMSM